MDSTIEKCRDALRHAYGDRLAGIVVYGSTARGDDAAESDVDLLVLLRGPIDYFGELRAITDLLYPVQLDSKRLLSAKPAAVEEYRSGGIQLYRNALREGISL